MTHHTDAYILENKDLIIDHAQCMAHKGVVGAGETLVVRERCLEQFVDVNNQIIPQSYYLYWWERREFFRILFHVRFFLHQAYNLKRNKVVALSTKEYAEKTGDDFSRELYAASLNHDETYDKPRMTALLQDDRVVLNKVTTPLHLA